MANDPASSSSRGKKRNSTSSFATPSPAPPAAGADFPAPSAPEAAAPSPPATAVSSSSSRTPSSVRALPSPQRCAACRHRRISCSAECPLAPYFPGNKPEMFENVRRLFGVKNLVKLMNKVEPVHHDLFMWSIEYEAEALATYPVHGALRVIRDREARLRDTIIERAILELRVLEAQQQQQHTNLAVVMPHATQLQLYSNNRSAGTSHGVTHQSAGTEVSTEQGMAMPNPIDYNDLLAYMTPATGQWGHRLVAAAQGASSTRQQNVMTTQQANSHLAAQNNAQVVLPHGHGTPSQHHLAEGAREQMIALPATPYGYQPLANAEILFPHDYGTNTTTVQQMAMEDGWDQGTMSFQDALGSNSGAALGAVHLGSSQLVFQQQQPQPLPPSPRPSWMALWDQQQQPSPPPSP